MDPHLVDIIALSNPWLGDAASFGARVGARLPDAYVPRALESALDWPVKRRAHLLIGARQVGKSSMLWHWFAQRNIAPLFLNAEELAIQKWCRSATVFLDEVKGVANASTPIFIEEAQHLAEAGLFIKGLMDGKLPNPLFVTGSSSFHLHAKTRESLAGRAVRAVLSPFSFAELMPKERLPQALQRRQVLTTLERHMIYGGYPEAWLSAKPQAVLTSLLEACVIRDASDLFRIQNLDAYRRLLGLIAGQVGSLVNLSEWQHICGVSRETIANYLDILLESHIVVMLRPYAQGKRAELVRQPKVYFCDNGLRNGQLRNFAPRADRQDVGALVENWVAAELNKMFPWVLEGARLCFWRSKSQAEVDFVIDHPNGLIGIEVKAGALKSKQLSRSSRSFIEAYRPQHFFVVNAGLDARDSVGDTLIRWLPFQELHTVLECTQSSSP